MVVVVGENIIDKIDVTVRNYNGKDLSYSIPIDGTPEIWKTEYADGEYKGKIAQVEIKLFYDEGIDEVVTTHI